MTDTPTLFDGPTYRATDPATSRQAPPPPVLANMAYRVLGFIAAEHQRTGQGATAAEVVECYRRAGDGLKQQNSVARRCTALARAGLIVDTGDTRPGPSGRQATVWAPTELGREALED